MLTDLANGLGALDAQLIRKDSDLLSLFEGIPGEIETPVELEHRTMSLLWVLGAYELVRTLSQRVKEEPRNLPDHSRSAVQRLKGALERLRIPLAKLERARHAPVHDFPIAFPVLEGQMGMAWRIGPKSFISRRQLADMVLRTLAEVDEASNIRLKPPTGSALAPR